MPKDARNYALKSAAAAIILVIWAMAFLGTLDKAKDDSALPDPGPRVVPAATGLAHLLNVGATAEADQPLTKEQTTGQRLLEFGIDLDSRLNDSFHRHLKNIAAQKGWHGASRNTAHMELTLPVNDIDQLEPLLEDPVQWVHANHQPGAAARPPDMAQPMVTAQLRIELDTRVWGAWSLALLLVGVATALSLGATLAWLCCALRAALGDRRHGSPRAGADRI